MHRPYRDIAKEGDMIRPDKRDREQKRSFLPTVSQSTVVNFIAIALLFAVIMALHQLSRGWLGGETEVTARAKPVTVSLEEVAATEATPAADNAAETTAASPPADGPQQTKAAAQVVTLDEDGKAKGTEADACPVCEPTSEEKKPARTKTLRYRASRKSTARDPYWRDRQASVEELDNHYARERYRQMNSELSSSGDVETRADTRYDAPPTREIPSYRSTSYQSAPDHSYGGDLDGESARQRYRAENRRLSGSDADLDY